jgi:NitT/TauT family transport system substrate-binding protein
MGRIRWVCILCVVVALSIVVAGETIPLLRFSLPPVLEALPIAFAHEWDLFEAHGVSVELIGITNNQQRSAALMTGNLDGMMEDITRSILDASTGADIVVTSAASSRTQTGSIALALLSPMSFGLDSIESLFASGYSIGTIYRSDYEYLLDRLLADRAGEDTEPPGTMYFHDILQMAVWFGAGTLPAAVLPEPYVSYLATYYPVGGQPIELVIHDGFAETGVLPSTVVFHRTYVENHPAAVAAFYAAYAEAIERINSTPREDLIDLGIDIALSLFFQGADRTTINQEVLDTISIPIFDLPMILKQSDYDAILAWMLDRKYVFKAPTYEEISYFQFIP